MAFNKRLFVGSADDCTTETADKFGDSSGVLLYSMDYDASDASGSYDGTPTDVTFGVGGQINYGARFNGTSSFVDTNYTLTTDTTFSFSWWMNADSPTTNHYIFNDGNGTGHDGSLAIYHNTSGQLGMWIGANGSGYAYGVLTITGGLSGSWMHFAVSVNGSTATVYKNGSSEGTMSLTPHSTAGILTLIIGRLGHFNGFLFKGDLDQIRYFNKAISATEVGELYAETACVHTATTNDINYPTTNLAYYKMDNSAEDSHSGTYDGTTVGSPIYTFGRYGQAIEFTVDSQYINTGLTPSILGTSFAASCWVYFESNTTGSDYYAIMGAYWNGSSGNQSWFLWNYQGTLKFFANLGTGAGGGSINFDGGTIELFKWHHVAFSVDHENEVNLYLNNVKTTQSNSLQFRPNSIPLCLGNLGTYNASRGMIGKMDQVRVFDSTITDAQVTSLFNEKQAYITKSASDPFGDGNEIAFYKMENNSNDSTNSNNGTNYGATFTTTDALFGTYSASFDGSNDYIQTSLSLNAASNTVSFWFNADSVGTQNPALYFNNRGGRIDIIINGTSSNTATASNEAIFINSTTAISGWNLATIVFTGWASSYSAGSYGSAITSKVYLNGNLLTSLSPTPYGQSDGLRIGRSGGTYYYDGLIDQVRIFDRALEGDEVSQLYAEVIN